MPAKGLYPVTGFLKTPRLLKSVLGIPQIYFVPNSGISFVSRSWFLKTPRLLRIVLRIPEIYFVAGAEHIFVSGAPSSQDSPFTQGVALPPGFHGERVTGLSFAAWHASLPLYNPLSEVQLERGRLVAAYPAP